MRKTKTDFSVEKGDSEKAQKRGQITKEKMKKKLSR